VASATPSPLSSLQQAYSKAGMRGKGKEMDSKALFTRRRAIGAALVGASPLVLPGQVRAAAPSDRFVVLLKGIYQPVVHKPDLGLSSVDLSDGSWTTVKIYPVSGTPGNANPDKAIGDFYAQDAPGDKCAYHLSGGSFAMQFTGGGAGEPDDDGVWITTWDLDFIEGTGVYRSFVDGHNFMVDRQTFLENGDVDEYCLCYVSGP
jgi:hypothetical protein